MDFLNKDASRGGEETTGPAADPEAAAVENENIVYIDNARVETASEQAAAGELLDKGAGWSAQNIGEILVSLGKLNRDDLNRIADYQHENGVYFGEAAIALQLVDHQDILKALSVQFGYSYGQEQNLGKEMVMARTPFSEIAEEFRSIRAQLLKTWLSRGRKTLAIVSPGAGEGRSYFAANMALAFSQLGKSTLLIDADLRAPRQHEIFNISSRIGLSMLLAGRVRLEELDMLPDEVPGFPHLSVLSCGAVPPNPAELLSCDRFPSILHEVEKYFDVIIIDSPSASYRSDILSIASVAGSALVITRSGYSNMEDTKALVENINQAGAEIVGAVLNQF